MITFIIAFVCLVLGYLLYGSVVQKVFGVKEDSKMPCYEKQDGVDYLPMATWRVFLVQFLNIAGTGPIFGAILGVLFGPAAYLWIVLGCIFAGAVHDYMCGMICIRKGGLSLPEIIGDELGNVMRIVMRVFSLVLLVLVGAVFVTTPADLLAKMTPDWIVSIGGMDVPFGGVVAWTLFIFLYYILATLLPIDKLIGKVYPMFGAALLIMAAGLCWGIFTQPGYVPEITDDVFGIHHPKGLPIFPMLCITIACGAISGFHATQSPLMARCLTKEKYGRPIFYGAMITEGLVALIWAAAAIKFADSLPGEAGQTAYEKLAALGTPGVVVHAISSSWMGTVGAVLAVLGVVAAPITSGDTAFRSARLIIADFMNFEQRTFVRRLTICLPIFAIAGALMFLDFNVLWRYFAWTNQTLAMFMLWTAAVWLTKNEKLKVKSEKLAALRPYVCVVPAVFMTVVSVSYILYAPEGFRLPYMPSLITGFIAGAAAYGVYVKKMGKAA